MKNKIYVAVLFLLAGFFVACEKDPEPFEGPSRLIMGGGPSTVRPESQHTYTLGDIENADTYTWSVQGPAEIVGNATGASVTVQFNSLGDVVLSVTNGRDARTRNITVAPPQDEDGESLITLSSSVNDPGVLRSGETDTLFLSFDQSLANTPTVTLITADTAFVSGSIGPVQQVSGMEYYVLYTAGEGNGVPTVQVSGIQANEAFGGATLEDQVVNLHEVDNVSPIADVEYSQTAAQQGDVVTMTFTFNEPVRDRDLFILLSGAGVTAERDTLMPTDNPQVYTYDYTVTGEGNGDLSVELENVVDLAGNELAGVNNADGLAIDHLAPTVIGTAVDNGAAARISLNSTESGTGMYLVLRSGQTAPANEEEFMGMTGVASGSMDLEGGRASSIQVALGAGNYVVYYLAVDEAGNYSDISSSTLVMN